MDNIPVQPVILTDQCGNLAGIPLPISMTTDYYALATDINAWAVGVLAIINPWSATNDRYLLGWELALASRYEEEYFYLNPEDLLYLHFTVNPGADQEIYRFPIKKDQYYDPVGEVFNILALEHLKYPIRVEAGIRMNINIVNQSDCIIDSSYIYLLYIEL